MTGKVGLADFEGKDTVNIAPTLRKEALPKDYVLSRNFPNPFNPSTTIQYSLEKAGMVSLKVYNIAGQEVATLVNGSMNAGTHSIVWDASGYSAGVYFYTVKAGDFSKTTRMTLLK